MTKIILSGCCGSMGKVVTSCAAANPDFKIVAGVDLKPDQNASFPIYEKAEKISEKADVLIDFSNPSLLTQLLSFGTKKKLPLVLCTTGYSEKQKKEMIEAAKKIPIFNSGNMSIGVNLLIELSKQAAKILGNSFDIEIVEMHHNRKLDAPSGTALMIADGVSEALGKDMHYVYDRHTQRKPREKDEIGIHSLRGGTVVGEHEVIFAGPQETITLSHSAQSRDIFANGALNAAKFISLQANGLYSMSDMLK